MAKFVAFYSLCPINDTQEFLGLSKDREDGNIITTLGRNIIIVIKLSTQKQIKSWTVLDKLSAKVVYDSRSDQYVGVFAQKYLRCWSEDEKDINKIKKMKFQKTIVDLISSEEDEVLVLYGDGSSEFLSQAKESRKSSNVSKKDDSLGGSPSISEAKMQNLPNGHKLLTYFETDQKTQTLKLVTATLNSSAGRPLSAANHYKLDRRDQNISLVGRAVVEGHTGPFLLTLWSDRRIFVLPLNEDTRESEAPGNFISMINLLNVDSPVSILGISKNCVAIYGSNSAQEGSSLLLYNTQFKVVNAKQFFKVYFNYSRLWVIDGNILLAMGQNLYVVSFRVSKELLSEMVGSQVSNDLQTPIGRDFIKEDDELEEQLEYQKTKPKSYSNYKPRCNENFPCADGRFVPYQPYDNFHEQLLEVVSRKTDLNLYSDGDNETKISLLSCVKDTKFTTDELEVLAKSLEEIGASEQEITEKILIVALKAGLTADIAVCLRKYSNVSQKILAKVLKYVLEDFSLEESISKEEEGEINGIMVETDDQIERRNLLNVVLSCSVDATSMLSNVKKELAFDHAVLLLRYLYRIACTEMPVLDERPEMNCEFDEDAQIMQWATIVINAFFQELGLSKSQQLIETLEKWKDMLQSYQNDLRSLNSLYALLDSLIGKRSASRDNRHCKWYSIEEVKLF